MSDTLQLLGKLVEGNPGRDAVHIAVIAVTCKKKVAPGDHVKLVEGTTNEVIKLSGENETHGIVDPYLRMHFVPAGQKFWLFLYPQTITSLRHEWTHPAFAFEEETATDYVVQKDEIVRSRKWLEEEAKTVLEMTYNELVRAARDYATNGDCHCLPFDTPDECQSSYWKEELWKHLAIAENLHLKNEVPSDTYMFRCAC